MEYSEQAILTVWGGSLIIGVVVIIVVAVLLGMIGKTAKQIEGGASAIWTQGKLVANNTIHIPIFLSTTNRVAKAILGTAVNILNGSKVVQTHIEGCPGCPDCLLSK
ncbi:MAG: hypothetical protein RJQ09_07945 [Cyclobacteriaceae bacterium]